MAEISWTEEAQRWLSDIYEYIAADNRVGDGSPTVSPLLSPPTAKCL